MQTLLKPKSLALVSAFVIGIFVIIHYWTSIAGFIGTLWKAFLPILIGGIIAYMLNILMSFYERHYFVKHAKKFGDKTRKPACIVLAILTVLAIIVLLSALVIPQLVSCVKLLVQQVPKAVDVILNLDFAKKVLPASIYDWAANLDTKIKEIDWQALITKVSGWLKTGLGGAGTKIAGVLSSTVSGVIAFVIGVIFAVYFLACRESVLTNLDRILNAFVKPKIKDKFLSFSKIFNECFHKYIVAQCLEALILGGLCLIGMLIFRLPYAVMISALVSFMALIPVIGGTISAVVGSVMILAVSPLKALIFFAMLMVVQVIEGNLIYPKVVGKSVGAPGLVVLAAVTVGGSVFGILGMLVAVPTVTALWIQTKLVMDKREGKQLAAAPKE